MANLGSVSALTTYVNTNIEDNTSNAVTPADVRQSIINTIDTLTGTPVGPGKVYEAALTQTGTDAPVAVVFQNTTGRTITWTRDHVGTYLGTFSSSIDSANSGCALGAPLCIDAQASPTWAYPTLADGSIGILTGSIAADGATEVVSTTSDGILDKTLIRIIIP